MDDNPNLCNAVYEHLQEMLSTKRKAGGIDLQRRVRARVDSDEEVEAIDSASSGGESDSQDEKSEGSEVRSQFTTIYKSHLTKTTGRAILRRRRR
jgi:hypothetical protein